MLRVNHLRKVYGELVVLDGVSLEIESNKTTTIIGPSGSGKSTLLRCMNLLEIPTGGTIEFGDQVLDFDSNSVKKNDMIQMRKRTGMVFQQFNLFPHMTVLNNIMEAPIHVLKRDKREVREEAEILLKKVGLLEKKDAYPSQLSGGQQQRIAIARALAMKPEILLFDEPTSALDPELEAEVLGLIKDLAKEDYTIAIVTHKMSFAREVSDQIVFLEGGNIVLSGSYQDLCNANNERISAFLNTLD
nr:amino acid ABC transporter ATP-binding protein [uncultured Mediterraneibacter sp.]